MLQFQFFNNIVDKSIVFSQTNGRFGNAYDLGLSATPGSYTVDNPPALSPYFSDPNFGSISVGDWGVQQFVSTTACGALGFAYANLDPSAIGFPPSMVNSPGNIEIDCYYLHVNNVIEKKCFYVYGNGSVSQTGTLIPEWVNENITDHYDHTNVFPILYSLGQAQCQN